MYKIVGFKEVNYTNKAGAQISGIEICVASENKHYTGYCTEKIFVSDKVRNECQFVPVLDKNVRFLYNRYGKVEFIEITK